MVRTWLALSVVGLLVPCCGRSVGDDSSEESGDDGSDGDDGADDGSSGPDHDDDGSTSGGTSDDEEDGATSGGTTGGESTSGGSTSDGTTSGGVACGELGEDACAADGDCMSMQGQQYLADPTGTWCLDPEPEFVYCTPAEPPCLPATQTICIGEAIYEAWSTCALPDGVVTCEPPQGPIPDCR